MPAFVIALLVAPVLLGVLMALARAVRTDGLGHRPPPPCRPQGDGYRAW